MEDYKSEGDKHIAAMKVALKAAFPKLPNADAHERYAESLTHAVLAEMDDDLRAQHAGRTYQFIGISECVEAQKIRLLREILGELRKLTSG